MARRIEGAHGKWMRDRRCIGGVGRGEGLKGRYELGKERVEKK